MPELRYDAPTGGLVTVSNSIAGGLARIGLAPKGLHRLQTVGRRSGEVRATPVNVLDLDGRRFLFSPRGHTQWVRNVRAGGAVALRRGRTTLSVTLVELADTAKPSVIRAYLAAWGWQVADFVDGLGPDTTDEQILAVAADFPVFEVHAQQ